MASREDCVIAINNFIKEKSMKNVFTLIEYLCEANEVTNKEETLRIINDAGIAILILPQVLDALETKFKITQLSKNGTHILVF